MRVSVGDGPGLVYSGDCGRADDLAGLLRRGDVLLSEVSFGAGPVPNDAAHLAGPDVGRLAAAGGAQAVLLTHVLMGRDRVETIASVQAIYDGPVRFVEPGDRPRIGPA
jgi:ribonuclease BN (tRNA processing enzyme)